MGKEYYENGKIKFEGIFINGKRNWIGKEYNSFGGLIFEGKFLDGLINGKGKEYYNNNSKFIGEYLNDTVYNGTIYNYEGKKECEIKNGKGKIKEYDYNGRLIFKGEYLNGKRNGKGVEYIDQKCNCGDKQIKCSHNEKISIFIGEFLNGERNGRGEVYNEIGKLIFKGEFLNGYKNGIGEEFNEEGNLIFKGEYLNEYKNGKGEEYDNDGNIIFKGQYIKGNKKNEFLYECKTA